MSQDSNANPSEETTIIGEEAQHDFGDRFQVLRWLGRGGMGDVYLAMDRNLHRRVAIKVIRPDLSEDQEIRQRIERECLLHAKVGPHPNIVTLFDKLERGGEIQLVMEYVEGQTLRSYLDQHEQDGTEPSRSEAFHITLQMLEALARIHAEGIVHRDIKPANVILAQADSGEACAKLMDFGIARLESGGSQFTNMIRTAVHSSMTSPGTPLYMAPEQFDSETFGPVSARTDVYAMGVVMYELLTGRPPFLGSLTEILRAHLNTPPPPLRPRSGSHVPEPLVSVVWTALAKKPGDRFASAAAFRDTLMHLSEIESASLSEMAQLPRMDSDHAQKSKEEADDTLAPAAPHRAAASSAAAPRAHRPAVYARVAVAAAIILVVLGFLGLVQVLRGGRVTPAVDTSIDGHEAAAAVDVPSAVQAPPAAITVPAAEAPLPPAFESATVSPPPAPAAVPPPAEIPQHSDESFGIFTGAATSPVWTGPQVPLSGAPADLAILQPEGFTIGTERMAIPNERPQEPIAGSSEPTVAAAREPVELEEETSSGPTYVVKPGDSLSKIAKQHNIDVYDLAVWNELQRPNDIRVNDTIYLYKRPNLKPVTPQFSRQPAAAPKEPAAPEPSVAAPEPPAREPAPPPQVQEEERRGVRRWFRSNVIDPLKSKQRK